MESVQQYASFIKRIFSAPPSIRKKLLLTSNKYIIKAIAEIILNIYYKNIQKKISTKSLTHMKRMKPAVLKIINASTGDAVRKELIVKHSENFVCAIKDVLLL